MSAQITIFDQSPKFEWAIPLLLTWSRSSRFWKVQDRNVLLSESKVMVIPCEHIILGLDPSKLHIWRQNMALGPCDEDYTQALFWAVSFKQHASLKAAWLK